MEPKAKVELLPAEQVWSLARKAAECKVCGDSAGQKKGTQCSMVWARDAGSWVGGVGMTHSGSS